MKFEPRKQNLIEFLKSNKSQILSKWKSYVISNWNSRLVANTFLAGSGIAKTLSEGGCFECSLTSSRIVSVIVEHLYSNLISLLENHAMIKIEPMEKPLPHFTPSGVPFTLSYFMDIFLSGKEAFSEIFLQNHFNHSDFSNTDADFYFETIDDGLNDLTQHYVKLFCEDCLNPLDVARQHVDKLTEILSQKRGEAL